MHSLPSQAGVKILTYVGWCASYNKGRVQSHDFLLLQQSNFSDAYTVMTKPAYVLSLGHNSRQSYKLFNVFENPWMKDDNNHLASELSKESARSVSQSSASPRTQDIKHRDNHSDVVLFPSNTLMITELTTPVQYSLRVRMKEQIFQIVSNRTLHQLTLQARFQTCTEVSKDM